MQGNRGILLEKKKEEKITLQRDKNQVALIKKREFFGGNFSKKFPQQWQFFFSVQGNFTIPLFSCRFMQGNFFYAGELLKKNLMSWYDYDAVLSNKKAILRILKKGFLKNLNINGMKEPP